MKVMCFVVGVIAGYLWTKRAAIRDAHKMATDFDGWVMEQVVKEWRNQ